MIQTHTGKLKSIVPGVLRRGIFDFLDEVFGRKGVGALKGLGSVREVKG
jgi:hypothetical protein